MNEDFRNKNLILLIVIILFFLFSITTVASLPSIVISGVYGNDADDMAYVAVYQDAITALESDIDQWINAKTKENSDCTEVRVTNNFTLTWREIIAMDSAILNQNFKKVKVNEVKKLANKFVVRDVRYEGAGDSKVAIITITTRDFETVLNEIVDDNEKLLKDEEDILLAINIYETLMNIDGDGDYNYVVGEIFPSETNGELAWPVPGNTRISSYFVERVHPIFGYKHKHTGIDIPAPIGNPVIAANDGIVVESRLMGGYGNAIKIDHGDGVVTLYGHNSKLIAKKGEKVKRGQVIAQIGSTGNSTGPHCHFEVRVNGTYVNPLSWVK